MPTISTSSRRLAAIASHATAEAHASSRKSGADIATVENKVRVLSLRMGSSYRVNEK